MEFTALVMEVSRGRNIGSFFVFTVVPVSHQIVSGVSIAKSRDGCDRSAEEKYEIRRVWAAKECALLGAIEFTLRK